MTSGRRRLVLAALLAATAAGGGCDRRRLGDLPSIRSTGELRVVVRPGYSAPGASSASRRDTAMAVGQLAARLGVRLRWVEARRHDQLLPWLAEGRADLALGRFSPAALQRQPGLASSAPVGWVEDLVVVGSASTTADFAGLADLPLSLHRSDPAWSVAPLLLGRAQRLRPVAEETSLEEILVRVAKGRYSATVVDSELLDGWPRARELRVVGPLAERRPLVWAVRSESHRLRAAVDDFLFAEQVLARSARTRACRDLPQIRRAGRLRLVTTNSPTTCTVERGGLEGFEYDLALSFARGLGGVALELEIPPPGVDPLDWLEKGYGDLAALHEPLALEDEGRFVATVVYRRVDLVSVVSARASRPGAVEDLAGRHFAASRQVASLSRLLPLEPPFEVTTPRPGADALTALLEVEHGRAEGAVVDADTLRLELVHRPGLVEGPTVVPSAELVWVVNPSAPRLLAALDGFLRRSRSGGLVRQLALAELTGFEPYTPPLLWQPPAGALTPFDELLRWAGRRERIDWRLLAALMYEESRFDPDAVGPGGSAGLFQLMPFTWRELGVSDPHDPAEAIGAGSRYLRRLLDRFPGLAPPDRVAMAIAAYNVGPRHVFDARRLAAEMGLDRNRWRGQVETAMLIINDPEVARRFPAGVCKCRRAVGYARRILRRYRAYAEQFPFAPAAGRGKPGS